MAAENPKVTVTIYKDGKDTGETKVLDLADPKVAEELKESLQKQNPEWD